MADDTPFAGKGDQVIGTGKEKVGELTDNPDLEGEGAGQRAAGKVTEAVNDLKRKAEDVVDRIRHQDN
jgi:uncharacterized protein YjbJ (UPF0337 family)